MKETLDNGDFEAMKGLTVAELQRLWRDRTGRRAKGQEPPCARALLVRDLAWWAQQGGRRGLDGETQNLLNAAVRQAENRAVEPKGDRISGKRKSKSKKPQLQAGVTLVRKWRGKTYKVKVIEDGKGRKRYEFAGEEYRSLTTIAQEITGAHWSGPRFFGLNRVRSTG
ncbi:MAG: DUF2924 domain-containing protein [Planctomycetota bacterium]